MSTPACVDLTCLRPRYAAHGSPERASLPEALLWQRWANDREGRRESVDLELFDADFAVRHPDATSVSCADLFFAAGVDEPLLDRAAHAFVGKLGKAFTSSVLVWLVPDFLNDFQLQVARRNLNTRFPEAVPLPRSVAAVFEQVGYSEIGHPGFQVLVVDAAGGTSYATKLIARHDPDLQERVPETRGFYWERSPHVTIEASAGARDPLAEIPYIDYTDGAGRWNGAAPPRQLPLADQQALRDHPQIGEFHRCITLSQSPVPGGIRLHDLQRRAGEIPLWRDHIPELSIKLFNGGRFQSFCLVGRGTTIRPLRGVPVRIPVSDHFTLPAGRGRYQFPLIQGQDPDDLGYVARLESPSFPLPADTVCRLMMTYTYGADDPYRLVFEPLDKSFKPVQVKWQPKTEETDAPAPEYPAPATWPELQEHWNAEKGQTTNYPDWAARKTKDLLDTLIALDEVSHGTITSDWRRSKDGGHFVFVERDDGEEISIRERSFAGREPRRAFSRGDDVYFVLGGKRPTARYVAQSMGALHDAVAKSIPRDLYVPYIRTWSDGRSLADPECPESFRRRMQELLPGLSEELQWASTPKALQDELRFLFSCIHKDMPESVSRQLASVVRSPSKGGRSLGFTLEKSLGFALGDLSQPWQQDILGTLLSRIDRPTLRVFALAIWRNEGFARAFAAADLDQVARQTLAAIKDATGKPAPSVREVGYLTRYCELLLGLLRSRDSADREVRMLLQPHQAITRELAEQVERATALIAQASVRLESRVQVANLPEKPEGDDTPDLLYALRLYLTGDQGADAIRVTSVSHGEDGRS